MSYKHDTYECRMCLWAEQCQDTETCDSFTPLDEELIDVVPTDDTRNAYRDAFLRYISYDNDNLGDWGFSYHKA